MIPVRGGELVTYVDRLRARQPFALSRWGDGEWTCLLGGRGQTCDGQAYTPQLREDLAAVLEARPSYELGLQGLARRTMSPAIQAWLDARGLAPAWVDADVFAHASVAGELAPFCAALATRLVVLVGPGYLSRLRLFRVSLHIVVPETNCHDQVETLVADTRALLEGLCDPVVLMSAGPTANVLVHRLWTEDPRRTLIDVGSLWEPYLGLCTRRYHQAVARRERAHA